MNVTAKSIVSSVDKDRENETCHLFIHQWCASLRPAVNIHLYIYLKCNDYSPSLIEMDESKMIIDISIVTLKSLHSDSDRDNWFEFSLISSFHSILIKY